MFKNEWVLKKFSTVFINGMIYSMGIKQKKTYV